MFSLVKTLSPQRAMPTVYEVKVSRADMLADLRDKRKRANYLKIANRVIYVTLPGIAEASEIPDPCGLWVEMEAGRFEQVKRPKTQRVQLRGEDWLNLLLKPPTAP